VRGLNWFPSPSHPYASSVYCQCWGRSLQQGLQADPTSVPWPPIVLALDSLRSLFVEQVRPRVAAPGFFFSWSWLGGGWSDVAAGASQPGVCIRAEGISVSAASRAQFYNSYVTFCGFTRIVRPSLSTQPPEPCMYFPVQPSRARLGRGPGVIPLFRPRRATALNPGSQSALEVIPAMRANCRCQQPALPSTSR
jgi:hypothetical protein